MKTVRYYIHKLPLNNPGWCRELAGDTANIDDYVPVYTGEIEFDPAYEVEHALEQLYMTFNTSIPEHYAAPSMSVGDVVTLYIDDEIKHYAVCNIGWKRIKFASGGYHA